jgi:hypothetical protein
MTSITVRSLTLAFCAATAAGAPAQAHHNDWAAPLVGGALGGYALSSLVQSSRQRAAQPTHVTPTYVEPVQEYVPAAPAGGTASVEARLRQLEQLAAQGYITQQEYQQRRQAILNSL